MKKLAIASVVISSLACIPVVMADDKGNQKSKEKEKETTPVVIQWWPKIRI